MSLDSYEHSVCERCIHPEICADVSGISLNTAESVSILISNVDFLTIEDAPAVENLSTDFQQEKCDELISDNSGLEIQTAADFRTRIKRKAEQYAEFLTQKVDPRLVYLRSVATLSEIEQIEIAARESLHRTRLTAIIMWFMPPNLPLKFVPFIIGYILYHFYKISLLKRQQQLSVSNDR